MSYDWHATFRISEEREADALIRGQGDFRQVRDVYGRLKLLSQVQALSPPPRWAKERTHYREIVHQAQGAAPYTRDLITLEQRRLHRLGILRPRLDADVLEMLPPGSFCLQFQFTLEEPFVSKDDASFYPHDNPLRKEWAFKVPMLGGSGWKGNLRAAMRWQNNGQESDDLRLLFGPPRPEGTVPEGYFRAGRLRLYPTYFDALELEMLNPHDRATGSGKDPFNLECVPTDGHGVFSLLYVPFDRAGWSWGEYRAEVGRHLKQVTRGLQTMFRTLGFSAKRTSGFGLAAEEVKSADRRRTGELIIHADVFREQETEIQPASPAQAGPPPRPDGVDEFMENGEFPILMRSKEVSAQPWGNSKKRRYKRVRDAYLAWKTTLEDWEQQTQRTEAEKPGGPKLPPLQPLAFASFAELVSVASNAARRLEVSHE
jgi:hypothetical protein